MARLDYLVLPDGKYLLVLDQLTRDEGAEIAPHIESMSTALQQRDPACLGLIAFRTTVKFRTTDITSDEIKDVWHRKPWEQGIS